jgi:hypothetical protein
MGDNLKDNIKMKEMILKGDINWDKLINKSKVDKNGRKHERIDDIMELIKTLWSIYPQQRLMQLLMNIIQEHGTGLTKEDPYYIEDVELIKYIKKHVE